jgi:hypothetical protein
LLGLGCLSAEPVDERFQLFDAVALVGVSRLDLRTPLGLLLFVFRVSAGIEPDLLVLDFGDLRNRHIEKKPIV